MIIDKKIFQTLLVTLACISLTLNSYAAPTTEWTYHKTPDNAHPSGREQEMVWLMNRAREQPAWEGRWLAICDDPYVANGRSNAWWVVDTDLLVSEFASYGAMPPAAFDSRLYEAASNHCEDLILRDAQDHTNQYELVTNIFHIAAYRGSVFSKAQYSLYAHAAFNIDWGTDEPPDGDGMQSSRGHRKAIMSSDHDYYSNVGVAMLDATITSNVGPIVTTINYADALTGYANHYDRFLVGTAWEDANSNGFYDDGEGKTNVQVMPNIGIFYAVTADSGGWAIPATVSGTYVLTFSGASIGADVVTTVEVGSVSVRVPWPGQETTSLGVSKYWHQSYGVFSGFDTADTNNDDSDQLLNWQEYVAGSIPTNASSIFEITTAITTNTQSVISWPSISGRLYTILTTDDINGTWTNAVDGTDMTGINGSMSYTNTDSISPRFFNIQVGLQ